MAFGIFVRHALGALWESVQRTSVTIIGADAELVWDTPALAQAARSWPRSDGRSRGAGTALENNRSRSVKHTGTGNADLTARRRRATARRSAW